MYRPACDPYLTIFFFSLVMTCCIIIIAYSSSKYNYLPFFSFWFYLFFYWPELWAGLTITSKNIKQSLKINKK